LPQYKTSQTTDDRQTTHCANGATDTTVGQKLYQKLEEKNTAAAGGGGSSSNKHN